MTTATSQPEPIAVQWFRFRPAYLLIAVAIAFFSVNFVRETLRVHDQQTQVNAIAAANQHERAYNRYLEGQIRLDNKPSQQQQLARQLGYVQTGDQPVIISYVKWAAAHHRPVASGKPPAAPAWQQWWNAFFGAQ